MGLGSNSIPGGDIAICNNSLCSFSFSSLSFFQCEIPLVDGEFLWFVEGWSLAKKIRAYLVFVIFTWAVRSELWIPVMLRSKPVCQSLFAVWTTRKHVPCCIPTWLVGGLPVGVNTHTAPWSRVIMTHVHTNINRYLCTCVQRKNDQRMNDLFISVWFMYSLHFLLVLDVYERTGCLDFDNVVIVPSLSSLNVFLPTLYSNELNMAGLVS